MKKIKLNTCAFVMKVAEHDWFKDYMLGYIKKILEIIILGVIALFLIMILFAGFFGL